MIGEKGVVTGIKIIKPQIKNSEQLTQSNMYFESDISDMPNKTSNNLNWSFWKKNDTFFGPHHTNNKISQFIEVQDNQNLINPIDSLS